jgi:hypothetical protein
LNISDVSVAVHVAPQAGATTTIEVLGPLRFMASRTNVWFSLAQDYSSSDGTVSMHRGAKLVHAYLDGNSVIAAPVTYARDVLPGEDKDADEFVVSIRVPCSMLTLDAPIDEMSDGWAEGNRSAEKAATGSWWEPLVKARRVRLYAHPWKGSPFVDIVHRYCYECFTFAQIGQQGEWLKVRSGGEGVSVRGWLRRSTMKEVPRPILGRGYGCDGDHMSGNVFDCDRRKGTVYDGPATLKARTQVFATPGRGEWATVVEDVKVQVRYDEGDTWAQVGDVPGVRFGKWLRAYVPLTALVLPVRNTEQ